MALFQKKTEFTPPEGRPVPRHIAFVMDGNGRWAKQRGMPRTAGHVAGSDTFRRLARYCKSIGVEYMTVYAFSTENWKRSEEEVSAIMGLLKQYILEALATMAQDQAHICFFGDLARLTPELRALCEKIDRETSVYEGLQVNICLNYGGRAEILHAAKQFARDCAAGRIDLETVDEAAFGRYLYSGGIPDPDLMIRPGGEMRISNFLLWQLAYAEFYFTDVLWPDFGPQELEQAIAEYNRRNRRFGGV